VAFIQSQRHEGWTVLPTLYDDGGYSGGTMERPALQRLLIDIEAGQIDVVVVYKVDRLTRALSDFAKLVEVFEPRRLVRIDNPTIQHHHQHRTAGFFCGSSCWLFRFSHCGLHRSHVPCRPQEARKRRGPDQCAPVIFLEILLRDG
jgi:hypothetical protein